ncbi:uncharacterized protein LOC127394172 [Apus apus]|uniref:uncharacterized protein LOC127394172 n=1 Tax=Apus apus TaxID=8895 RepID=UPI0021F91A97|nr:uncharacterized protein LOC127394172 [Apus apus]
MDPAVPKATLKVLGLCAALLVLVAAVTVAVAVMVWRSEALGKLRGCRERAVNESRELGNRVAELERERARLRREEGTLRRQLVRARGDGERLNVSLGSCRERVARLEANTTALGDEVVALRHEQAELARAKAALQGEVCLAAMSPCPPATVSLCPSTPTAAAAWEELARGEELALGLRQQLEEAAEQQRALRGRGEQCEARQRQLETTLRDYAAEVETWRRRGARGRATGRRCPPSR